MNLPEELTQELQKHDWTFEWADDGRTYNAGSAHRKNIVSLARHLRVKKVDLLRYVEEKFIGDKEIITQWKNATSNWD